MPANGKPHWSNVPGKITLQNIVIIFTTETDNDFFRLIQALNISPVDNEELDRVLTHSLDKAKVSLLAFGLDQPEDELRKKSII